MSAPASITITRRLPSWMARPNECSVYGHVIDHPAGQLLVDTGMTELDAAVADMNPRLHPLTEHGFDLDGLDIVVSTHLHFDRCGGYHLFAGRPIYAQRHEREHRDQSVVSSTYARGRAREGRCQTC